MPNTDLTNIETSIISAIKTTNRDRLYHALEQHYQHYGAWAIHELYASIYSNFFFVSCADFIQQTPFPRKRKIEWLKKTLENHPYSVSIMALEGVVASYECRQTEAKKLHRLVYANCLKIYQQPNMTITPMSLQWPLIAALFSEDETLSGEKFNFETLIMPETLIPYPESNLTLFTAFSNPAYLLRYGYNLIANIRKTLPENPILIVIGDCDQEAEYHIKYLQTEFQHVHFAYDGTPEKFKNNASTLIAYYTTRRFTYMNDIFEQLGDIDLISFDFDFVPTEKIKDLIDYTKSAPFAFCALEQDIFAPEQAITANIIKFDNSLLGKKTRQLLDDYLRIKMQQGDTRYFIDQHGLCYVFQLLSDDEKKQCYNLVHDMGDVAGSFMINPTAEEVESKNNGRFFFNQLPTKITFEPDTLKPILHYNHE